jgi:hypothetical protein
MRLPYLAIATAVLAAHATATTAQDRVALGPSLTDPATAAHVSQSQAAINRAATTQKYVFLFFWKERNAETEKAWSVFQPAAVKLAASAEVVSVQTTNPAEKQVVDRYGVDRAPMPLVLALGPSGAITKAFTKAFDENQLRTAFVSPGTQRCLKALQNRLMVFVCVVDKASPQDQVTIPRGVQDFKADPLWGLATEIILVNARDEGEAAFLNALQIDPKAQKPVAVFLAPPGAMIGTFDGTATKQQIVDKLLSAQSNPCAGGKCGPGGCPPPKQPPK